MWLNATASPAAMPHARLLLHVMRGRQDTLQRRAKVHDDRRQVGA